MTSKINEELDIYPVLPLRDVVIFPRMIVPLFVGREKSIIALQNMSKSNKIFLVSQKDGSNDIPKATDLYKIGVIAKVLQIIKLQDSSVKILVEGLEKAKAKKYISTSNFFKAKLESVSDTCPNNKETVVLRNAITTLFKEYLSYDKRGSQESLNSITQTQEIIAFCNALCSQIHLSLEKKQCILELTDVNKKFEKLMIYISLEIELSKAENKIRTRVKKQIEKNQKDYYLHEQLKAIHKELGEDDSKEELNELSKSIAKLKLSNEAKDKMSSELKKLKMMNPMSSEATVTRNYIDWVISLPWNTETVNNKNLGKAQNALDQEHYALNKVKERIIEHIAVNIKSKKLDGSIICLVGPPGVGKTSLAKSMAKATGRNFAKISLGGLRDEAEIKGHRKTYIGAMPGKIIQALKKSGSSNSLILLDEIDKLGNDYRGDPSSALLEVLDGSQNKNFNDHYLEIDFDLSKIMFVATANSTDIPSPLLDRMEVIRVSGYTEKDKSQIALKHLIPKIRHSHSLNIDELSFDNSIIIDIIRYYTRESGVRNLNREIEKIFRKSVKEILVSKKKSIKITNTELTKYLGPYKYTYGIINNNNRVGITNGLAYTEEGGDLLAIEAVKYKGKGHVKITGKLGDVMKESVQAAHSYIHSKAKPYRIKEDLFQKFDIHIHVPEGAVPKDGPSAGITIATSIVSILTETPVKKNIAMTGEITLRGSILPIGGLKEKLLAALRGGVQIVIIPKDNIKDMKEIPQEVKDSITIIFVESFDEVIENALEKRVQLLANKMTSSSLEDTMDKVLQKH